MCPVFDDLARIKDKNAVEMLDGRETMGDDEGCLIPHEFPQAVLDVAFRLGVERARCFVQNEDRGILHYGARIAQR